MSPEVNEANVPLESGAGAEAVSEAARNGPWILTRRQVLGTGVAASLGAMLVRFDPQLHDPSAIESILIDGVPQAVIPITPAQPALHFSLERDSDLFLADITFYGFTLVKGTTYPSIVATTPKLSTNWIGAIVQLPPQAIGEGNYDRPSLLSIIFGALSFDPTPILSQVSGPSRLAFTFNHGDKVPLKTGTVADLMDWSGWRLNVPPTARTGTGLANALQPKAYETAIELPLALFLAPVVDGTGTILKGMFTTKFINRTEPLSSPHQVTECWTTSLSSVYSIFTGTSFFSDTLVPSVSAVWATDYLSPAAGNATGEQEIQYDKYVVIA